MTPHFSLAEFTASDTAARLGIDNSLPDELRDNAEQTLQMMERIRLHINAPITITSGYRCEALNRVIGSKPGSDHTLAFAVDFKASRAGTPAEIAKSLALVVDMLGIGQLILEYNDPNGKQSGWIHTSIAKPQKIINRIITINKNGIFPGIVECQDCSSWNFVFLWIDDKAGSGKTWCEQIHWVVVGQKIRRCH